MENLFKNVCEKFCGNFWHIFVFFQFDPQGEYSHICIQSLCWQWNNAKISSDIIG